MYDEYEIVLGRLFERLKSRTPFRERVHHIPREMFQTMPVDALVFDRFVPRAMSSGLLSYPLMQYGPGVASYNVDGASYSWPQVREGMLELFTVLKDLHPDFQERINTISLRAIDFFPTEKFAEFLRTRLRVNVSTELEKLPQLAEAVETPRLQSSWQLPGGGMLRIGVGPGFVSEQNGLLLDISAESGAEAGKGKIEDLIDFQHKLAGDAFFALISQELRDELGSP